MALAGVTHSWHSDRGWARWEGPRRFHPHPVPLASPSPHGLSSHWIMELPYGTGQPPKGIASVPAHSVGQPSQRLTQNQVEKEETRARDRRTWGMEWQELIVTFSESYLPQKWIKRWMTKWFITFLPTLTLVKETKPHTPAPFLACLS